MHLKVCLSLLLEKLSQQREALLLHHARFGLRLGMKHLSETREAIFRVIGGPDHLADMGMTQGSGAHGAGLQGDIERAFVEVFGAQSIGCCSNG